MKDGVCVCAKRNIYTIVSIDYIDTIFMDNIFRENFKIWLTRKKLKLTYIVDRVIKVVNIDNASSK